MTDEPEPTAASAACPRCGYDQRGETATWVRSSPIEGTCTECGLVFEWGELLSRKRGLPRWCVERRVRAVLTPPQVAMTFVRTFWPWSFWTVIRMSHAIRWRRIASYLVVLAILLYVVFAVSHAWLRWSTWNGTVSLPQVTASTSGWPVFLQALALPFSDRSIGAFSFGPSFYPYATPLQDARTVWLDLFPLLLIVLAQQAACGLTFALLPVSRRRARVRWRHIFRVTLYGYGLFALPIAIGTVATVMIEVGSQWSSEASAAAIMAWFALPLAAVAWWSVATERYLMMRHPWGVGLAVVVIGVLVVPTVIGVTVGLVGYML